MLEYLPTSWMLEVTLPYPLDFLASLLAVLLTSATQTAKAAGPDECLMSQVLFPRSTCVRVGKREKANVRKHEMSQEVVR